jgi:ubiquinone/menaquinone biosynthesis C-methylase UbiE
MNTFIELFYSNVQINYGSRALIKAKEYCGEDYWKPHGNSTYNTPVMKLKETEDFANVIISRCEPGNTVLELGCAGGYFTYLLNKAGVTCYGQDISEFAVEAGKKEFGEVVDGKLFVGSIDKLSSIPDNSIDVVYSQQVLEHIPTERVYLMLKELNRVCKNKADLYLYWVIGYDDSVARARSDKDATHWNLKPYRWWSKAFKKFGFIPMLDSGGYSTDTYVEQREMKDMYNIQKIEDDKMYMFFVKD